jgi:thiol-disulfide isomerase/thioredoxin
MHRFLKTLCALALYMIHLTAWGQSPSRQYHIVWDTLQYPKEVYGWEAGMTVPNLALQDINGKSFQLYSLLDKLTIIDFWFINCHACVHGNPYLKNFYSRYGINIVAISIDERESMIKKFVSENDIPWLNIQDNYPRNNTFKAQIAYPSAYPSYILITPDKKVKSAYHSGRDMPKIGLELQAYFGK